MAQSALHQLGASRTADVGKLVSQLQRKPPQFDGSMEALMSGGNAMRGMALRALGVGASNGLGSLGDKSATAALWRVALDPLTNEGGAHERLRRARNDRRRGVAAGSRLRKRSVASGRRHRR
jgi:hypothetical protein